MNSKNKTRNLTICSTIGFALFVAGSIMKRFMPEDGMGTFARITGLIYGIGIGMAFVSAMFLVSDRKKSPEERRRDEIAAKDERNVMINHRASSIAFIAAVLLFAVQAIVGLLADNTLLEIFGIGGLYVILIVMFIAKIVLNKKM